MVCFKKYHASDINKALYHYRIHKSFRMVESITGIGKSSIHRFYEKYKDIPAKEKYKKKIKYQKETLKKLQSIKQFLGDGQFIQSGSKLNGTPSIMTS